MRTFGDLTELIDEAVQFAFPQKNLGSLERLLYFSMIVVAFKNKTNTFDNRLYDIEQLCGFSETTARKYLRELQKKGLVDIEERGRFGHRIRVYMGDEIKGIIKTDSAKHDPIDVEAVDFYDRAFIPALLERQGGRCLYSLKALTDDNAELDHIKPSSKMGGNSYRNICVCSFDMNKLKGGTEGEEFLRKMYRVGFLSECEFQRQFETLSNIISVALKPTIV